MNTRLLASESHADVTDAFRRLADIADRGLPRMLLPSGDVFCHRALQRSGGALELEGVSERYTAMTVIGAERWAARGGAVSLSLGPIYDRLAAWSQASPGDLGLVLWAQLQRGDARAEATAKRILSTRAHVFAPTSDFASMEMGFLLNGLAAGRKAGLPGIAEFADEVANTLLANQSAATALFSFGRAVRRKNFLRTRRDVKLGSFASQVYPTMGLAALTAAGGDAKYLEAARRCADRIASLQGPEGQWWWIYQRDRGVPACRYPVYSVHQDAMGPMILLAVAAAARQPRRYDAAVAKSLAWFDRRAECAGETIVDDPEGMVWRAVQHDDPAHTGLLGLGDGEVRRLTRIAWTGGADARPFARGFVCPECRPYHLGWVWLAAAMWAESLA
jgi:hypothetical protein